MTSVEPGVLGANVLAYAINADAAQHVGASGNLFPLVSILIRSVYEPPPHGVPVHIVKLWEPLFLRVQGHPYEISTRGLQ
jgi:hypothetical protein